MISNTPNFIIAGVMKAGTTAAAFNLNKHQDIYVTTTYWKDKVLSYEQYNYADQTGSWGGCMKNKGNKEMDFFNRDENYALGLDVYKTFFPQNKVAIGESSPNYFGLNEISNGGAASRIASDLPEAKVIILLRDPISRSYSHFNHIQEKNPTWGSYAYGKSFDTVVNNYSASNIFQRSLYNENLTTWLTDIGSDKIYVALQESIAADSIGEYNKICTFLGVEHFQMDQRFDKVFTGTYDGEIEQSTINTLKPRFAADVTAIKDLYPHLDYSLWHDYS
tara:strand:- start:543 stop:1373 length:831 start_codon:yes stop_codon:yes gene_type:complete